MAKFLGVSDKDFGLDIPPFKTRLASIAIEKRLEKGMTMEQILKESQCE